MTDHKPDDAPEVQELDTASVSDTEMDELADAAQSSTPHNHESTPAKRRRIGPWLFLLVVFAGLPAAWFYSPPEIRQQVIDGIESLQTDKPAPAPAQQPAEPASRSEEMASAAQPLANEPEPGADEAEVTQAEAPAEPASAPEPAPVEAAPVPEAPAQTEEAPVVDAFAAMQAEIERMQSEIDRLRADNSELTSQLKQPPVIELRVWLSLLASPDTPLLQRAQMWGYLASRPSLEPASKETAESMAKMLMLDSAKLDRLRAYLRKIAEIIPEERRDNIIPDSTNPYFAWLSGMFQLRKAPTPGAQDQFSLRLQLLGMEHALAIGDWPEQKTWEDLLDTAQATLVTLDQSIPADMRDGLEPIRKDIDASRKHADDWAERL